MTQSYLPIMGRGVIEAVLKMLPAAISNKACLFKRNRRLFCRCAANEPVNGR